MAEKTLQRPFDEEMPENDQKTLQGNEKRKALETAFLELLEEVRTYDADKRKRNLSACAYHLAEQD